MGIPRFRNTFEPHSRVERQAKIVGGSQAEPNEFPYQVQLQYNDNLLCGGTILNALFILTAAHCVKYKITRKIVVVGGDHHRFFDEGHEQERNVSHVFIHEDYNWNTDLNDIALLALSTPFDFNQFVSGIDFPRKVTEFQGMGVVSGWGKLSETSSASDILQKVRVPIVKKSECGNKYRKYRMKIAPSMLCAGAPGKDSCGGDSGGPLTCRMNGSDKPVVCGVVSHGLGCGRENYPGVYSDVSHFSKWIDGIMEKYAMRGKCRKNEIHCPEDKICIPRSYVCNAKPDCSKGSDEINCHSTSPSPMTHFRCNNGLSIKSNWVCDNADDCGDNSDEDRCNFRGETTCSSEQFVCKKDGRCIDKSWKCDGMIDCEDGTDESGCNQIELTSSTAGPSDKNSSCGPRKFQCKSGDCVRIRWKCDGELDCPDGDDEMDCPTSGPSTTTSTTLNPNSTCSDTEFHCSTRFGSGYCIPIRFKCDRENDCVNGEDEKDCPESAITISTVSTSGASTPTPTTSTSFLSTPTPTTSTSVTSTPTTTTSRSFLSTPTPTGSTTITTGRPEICTDDEFRCQNVIGGSCLPVLFKCDGDPDCINGEDEKGCPSLENSIVPTSKPNSTCSETEFHCPTRFGTGYCIPIRFKCDRENQCINGEDEEDCPTSEIPITPKPTRVTSTISTTTKPTMKNPKTCKDDQFRCPSVIGGYCLPMLLKCDGDPDCINGEDEEGCSSLEDYVVSNVTTIIPTISTSLLTATTDETTVKKCNRNQFQCLRSKDCISQTFVCDMDNDCEDGSDEAECVRSTTCSALQWRCQNGDCIYHRFRCDNDLDCTDHSDEEGCTQNTYFTTRF